MDDNHPGAIELLEQLKARGLHLTNQPDGTLHVGPRSQLDAELSELIASRKADLLYALAAKANAASDPQPEPAPSPRCDHSEFVRRLNAIVERLGRLGPTYTTMALFREIIDDLAKSAPAIEPNEEAHDQ